MRSERERRIGRKWIVGILFEGSRESGGENWFSLAQIHGFVEVFTISKFNSNFFFSFLF